MLKIEELKPGMIVYQVPDLEEWKAGGTFADYAAPQVILMVDEELWFTGVWNVASRERDFNYLTEVRAYRVVSENTALFGTPEEAFMVGLEKRLEFGGEVLEMCAKFSELGKSWLKGEDAYRKNEEILEQVRELLDKIVPPVKN